MAEMPTIKRIYLLQMTEKWSTYVVEFTDGTARRFTIEHKEDEEKLNETDN